jgi:homocysteine S-methyltransferase
VNPGASNADEELRRFEYKVEASAEFVVTWPVFDLAAFERFMKRLGAARLPVVAGILPFESARHAEFIANEVPGSSVPDALLDRMRGRAADQAAAEGAAIARETAQRLRPLVQGLHILAPGPVETALGLVESLR